MTDSRDYPDRPYLAVSAVIVRDERFLLVRRARAPARGLFTLPGGAVECGETLASAVTREVREEVGLDIEPVVPAGYREVIARGDDQRIVRHFVIIAFAARWRGGEPVATEEVAEWRWALPADLAGLPTTEGLEEIVRRAFALLEPP